MDAQSRPDGVAPAPATARGARTRQALIRAAREVFERDGYIDARIIDITAEAGVATGTFYTHFTGKDRAFAAVIAELQDELFDVGATGSGDRDVRRGIEEANRAFLSAYRRNARLMAVLEQAATVDDAIRRLRRARSQTFIDRNAAAIVRLQAAGLADRELDALFAARALNAMVSRMAYVAFVLGEPMPFDQLVTSVTRLWSNALRLPSTAVHLHGPAPVRASGTS
ncbi:MAG TPA: TetR/AcrR family transcriptional regulator [Euzebya sp.]|nr:TetR/AcrR family transcriptional regulator [Euzebya sp.]